MLKSTQRVRVSARKMLSVSSVLVAMLVAPHMVNAQEDQIDEVVVTGIQQSMQAANDLKRNDARIVDAIVAEDIGKLPDNNIAEALQRITGVSINSDFGVGDRVSIRGLPQNRVELNGRSTVGDDRDGISLQDFPSSFLQSVEVVKSPTADMIEGALGGTVRMRTLRPLELSGLTIAGSFDLEQGDKTEETGPIGNIVVGNSWDLADGSTLGVIGMYSTQERTIRQDEFFNRVRLYDEDVNGLTANTPSGRFIVRDQNTVQQFEEERDRTAINLSVQWEPASQQGSLFFDYTMTDRSGQQLGSSILDVGGSRTYGDDTSLSGGQVNNYTLSGAFVIPKTWSDFRETESDSLTFGGKWNWDDNIVISGEYTTVSSDSNRPDSELNLRPISKTDHAAWVAATDFTLANETCADEGEVAGTNCTLNITYFDGARGPMNLRHTIDAVFRQSGSKIPSIVYSDPNALTAEENLALRDFIHDEHTTNNEETAYRLDVDFTDGLKIPYVSSLQAGLRGTENDYRFNRSQFSAKNLYRYMHREGLPYAIWIDDFEEAHPGSFVTVNHKNSFDQAGLSGQNDLLTYRIFDANVLANPEEAFRRVQSLLQGTIFENTDPTKDTPPPYSLETTGGLADNLTVLGSAYRDITEETMAFYVSADLDINDRLTGVVGLRQVETDVSSTVIIDDEFVAGSNSYDDLLPSVNMSYELDDNSLLRFAYAQVMRRPNYDELSPAFVVDNSVVTATRGAIDLDPYRATQFDISYERYFDQGGIFSFAVYTKDVESFLSSITTCDASPLTSGQNVTEYENVCLLDTAGQSTNSLRFATSGQTEADIAALRDQNLTGIRVSSQTNGEDGTVEGYEIGFQQQFSQLPGIWSGLGVNVNYTYADSEQPNGNPLLDISENTYNIQGYWEQNGAAIRLAYNYRDEYLFTEEEKRVEQIGARALGSSTNDVNDENYDITAGNNWRDARGQLDLSGSYMLRENVTFVGSITNLLGEPSTFSTELGTKWRYTEADRRIAFGIRAKY